MTPKTNNPVFQNCIVNRQGPKIQQFFSTRNRMQGQLPSEAEKHSPRGPSPTPQDEFLHTESALKNIYTQIHNKIDSRMKQEAAAAPKFPVYAKSYKNLQEKLLKEYLSSTKPRQKVQTQTTTAVTPPILEGRPKTEGYHHPQEDPEAQSKRASNKYTTPSSEKESSVSTTTNQESKSDESKDKSKMMR